MTRSILIGLGASLVAASLANAGVSGTTGGDSFSGPGWDVPPVTLGAWNMTQYDTFDPFVADLGFTNVASSDSVPTHTTVFSSETQMRIAGSSWATWSGGYLGSVYYAGTAQEITLTLSPGTVAYSLFFQPNPFSEHDFKITGFDNLGNFVSIDTVTDGTGGATWAGFWTDGSTTLTSIRVVTDAEFAVGRFGYAVPAPGAIALIGLTGLVGARRRRA